MANQPIATVVAVTGKAFARNENGEMRALKAGDALLEGETVITYGDGRVELSFTDGSVMEVVPDQAVLMIADLFESGRPDVAEAALAGNTTEEVLQALAEGRDIDTALEAPAAGLEGGGEDDGSNFVRLLRITEEVDPLAFEFEGAPASEPPTFEGGLEEDTVPVAGVDSVGLDEDGEGFTLREVNPGGDGDIDAPASIVGSMNYSFGNDGPAATDAFRWTGVSLPGGEDIYSGGQPVHYEISADGLTLRGYIEGTGEEEGGQLTVFEVVVTNPNTGAYSMTLFRPLDHSEQGEDNINITFNYRLEDGDGSTADGTLTATINDDTPVWQSGEEVGVSALVDEAAMSYADGDLSEGNDAGGGEGAPAAGTYMAELSSTGAGNQASIESFLGVSPGGLTPLAVSGDGYDNATNGSAMKTTLNVNAGDQVSFKWAFDADDYSPYNDFTFVVINGEPFELADISQVGSYNATQWATFTYTATSTGPLTIGFGAMNTGDSGVDTYLLVDEVKINGVSVPNGGFETGDFSNWETLGAANVVTFHDEISGGSSDGDEAGGLSGSLASLVSFGADGPGEFSLLTDTSALPTLYSQGEAVSYSVEGNTLTATAGADEGARVVFTLTVNADGSWYFDLTDQLDHVPGNGENTDLLTGYDGEEGVTSVPSIDFSSLLKVTDFDGDELTSPPAGSFTIVVQDDVPMIDVGLAQYGEEQQYYGEEQQYDGMPILTTQDADTIGEDDPETPEVEGQDTASASFAGLFTLTSSVGADEPGTEPALGYSLSIPEGEYDGQYDGDYPLGGGVYTGLTSQGNAIILAMDGNDVVGSTSEGAIFRVSVNAETGEVTLTQYARIDHVGEGDDGNDFNNDVSILGLPEGTIFLTASASITDFDGDTASDSETVDISGAFHFEDDVPVLTGQSISVTVDEDDIKTVLSQGNHPNDGNADGSFTGDPAKWWDSGPANVSGSLASLVAFGADEEGGFSLSDDFSGLLAQDLFSRGEALDYSASGDTLTATAGGRTVFTLTVSEDGDFTFKLYDQMDHPEGEGENNLPIDLSSAIVATDGDGDSITLDGNFTINVTDDMPKEAGWIPSFGIVEEEALDGGNQEYGDIWPDTAVAAGSVAWQASVGADEPITFSLSEDFSNLPVLTSGGVDVTYSVDGNTLTATAGEAEVFTLVLGSNGAYTFTLLGPLDHAAGHGENLLLLNLSPAIVATDNDGDSITLTNALFIKVVDDMPSVAVSGEELPALTLDESPMGAGDGSGVVDNPADLANHDFANAIDLDGHFTLASNPDVQDSETVPFVSVHATGNNAWDYYSFTVTEAGSTAVFDIDYAMPGFDSVLRLYDANGVFLVANDDNWSLDPGTVHGYDSYLTHTFAEAGTYYIAVSKYSASNIPAGGTYQLQVSLTNAIMGGDGDGVWTASADFSGNFDFAYGADGPGNLAYGLSLAGDEMGSGLFALDPENTAEGEFGKGAEIMLSMDNGAIVGMVDDTEYFRITVNGETGEVTFTRYESVWHADTEDHDDASWLNAAEGTILLTATITDADVDTASASLDLSGGVFSIQDDGPTAALVEGIEVMPQLVVDESALPAAGDGIREASADFTGSFAAPIFGADGPGSVGYGLALTGTGVGSGLYAVDAEAVDGKGEEILLYQEGEVIEGRVGDQVYFTISVDSDPNSATFGRVTFAQIVEEGVSVWHSQGGDMHDDAEMLTVDAGEGDVPNSLHLVQTVTDADGDTASASLDLSGGVFSIQDDGPTAALAEGIEVMPQLVVDESALPADGDGIREASADFTGSFAEPSFGADGPGSVGYGLALTGTGVGSGLYAVDADAEDGKGEEILLYQEGEVIEGRVGDQVYFTISVDSDPDSATFGRVTFAQTVEEGVSVWHSQGGDMHDDAEMLTVDAGEGDVPNSLHLVQTVTDADGDTASASLDLGAGVFSVEDDGPTVSVGPAVSYTLDITNHDEFSSAGYNNSFGYYIKDADGNPTTGMVIWDNVKNFTDGSVTITGYTPDQVGFFIIPNGDSLNGGLEPNTEVVFVQDGLGNWQAVTTGGTPLVGQGANVLFDTGALNADGLDHAQDNALPGNLNWEDIHGGGDNDYNDVNIGVAWSSDLPVLTTQDAETIGDLTDEADASFAAFFNVAGDAGADGGSTTVAYSLSVTNAEPGLSSDGLPITLEMDGNDVVGSTTAGPVFRISVDAEGNVKLQQYAEVDHLGEDADGDSSNNSANLLGLPEGTIALTATASIIDGDGDTAGDAQTLDISSAFHFEDDVPVAYDRENSVSEPSPVFVSGLEAGFVNPAGHSSITGTDNDHDTYDDVISWGTGGTSSYAFVDNSQFVDTGAPISGIFKLGTFTHNNQPITSGTSLSSVDLVVKFMVNGVEVEHTISLDHNETPNSGPDPRDIITIAGGTLTQNFTVDGQLFQLRIEGFKVNADDEPVTQIYTEENASNSFDLFASVQPIGAPVEGTVDPYYGADGPGEVVWEGGTYDADAGTYTILNEYGTFVGHGDGSYEFTPFIGVDVADDVPMAFDYIVRDGDGDEVGATLTVTLTDSSEVAAADDSATATEGYWTRGDDITLTTEVGTPESWSAGEPVTVGGTLKVDPAEPYWSWLQWQWINPGPASKTSDPFTIAADASHPAQVSFGVFLSGFQSGDVVKIYLYKDGSHVPVQTLNITTPSNPNLSFAVASSGTYRVQLWADDNSNNGDLKAELRNLSYESYSYTPATTTTVELSAPGIEWVSGTEASGNVMDNDSPGSEGAVVTMVNGEAVADSGFTTITGAYGTLSINAQGEYTYTPNDQDNPGGAEDAFLYTLSQPDGDTATATLTVSLTDHLYNTVATEGDDFLGGGDGDDILDGQGGNDVIYGGAGDDTLTGGEGNDNLVGGLGADTFVWNLGDQGSSAAPALDVTDFNVLQGDVLDLHDLLQGEHDGTGVDSSNLTQYLSFGVESGKLVLSVDHDGGGTFAATQKIVLGDYADTDALAADLGLSSGATAAQIIDELVANGNLKTDI